MSAYAQQSSRSQSGLVQHVSLSQIDSINCVHTDHMIVATRVLDLNAGLRMAGVMIQLRKWCWFLLDLQWPWC